MYYWQFWAEYCKNISDIAFPPEKPSAPSEVAVAKVEAGDELSPIEKYEYLSEYGTQILCMLHPQEGCTYLSRNFESITGNRQQHFIGMEFFNVMHPDYHERLHALLSFENQESQPHSLHCRLKHGDDSWEWYKLTVHRAQQKDGACVCIIDNIHESVQAQSTLQKAKLEAELALSARSDFLANMSHDLRTPLNAVIGFAQIIESQMFGQVGAQYLEYAKHIQESGYDLLSKIEDLLEIASIDAGRVRLDKQDVYLNDLLKHAIGTQAHHAVTAEVLVEYAPPSRGDILLNVDRMKLQHIIGHLLANAIKFSHRGGKVTVEAELEDKQFILRISDHGVGMSEAKLAEIKEALKEDSCWSIGNNTTIGLGLALTREFISLHGGNIALSSAAGDGTTVEILLPETCLNAAKALPYAYAQAAG